MNAVAKEAASSRFTNHGDGTVTDTVTGLMWTQHDVTAKPVNHDDAIKACAECNTAGYTDWQLPTVEELFCLADRSREYPAIDQEAFPSCDGGWYWSSTLDCASPSVYAWFVSFGGGDSNVVGRDGYNRVRAVRRVPRQ